MLPEYSTFLAIELCTVNSLDFNANDSALASCSSHVRFGKCMHVTSENIRISKFGCGRSLFLTDVLVSGQRWCIDRSPERRGSGAVIPPSKPVVARDRGHQERERAASPVHGKPSNSSRVSDSRAEWKPAPAADRSRLAARRNGKGMTYLF